jgi:hypothetical protein
MMQFHREFEAVESAIPQARTGSGKISPMTTEAPGPRLLAKKKMYRPMNAVSTRTAVRLPPSPAAVPITATRKMLGRGSFGCKQYNKLSLDLGAPYQWMRKSKLPCRAKKELEEEENSFSFEKNWRIARLYIGLGQLHQDYLPYNGNWICLAVDALRLLDVLRVPLLHRPCRCRLHISK